MSTPGPWVRDIFSVYADGGRGLIVREQSGNRSVAERTANARLIAAAPELLEALEEFMVGAYSVRSEKLCAYCGYTGHHNDVCRVGKAEAAIRKAKGEM